MVDRLLLKTTLIDSVRVRKGLTRAELAAQVGFAPETMVKISKGKPVALRTAKRLAQSLGVKLPEILRDQPEMACPEGM